MSEDHELDFLRRRKLLEMQRQLIKEKALQAKKATKEKEKEKPKTPEEVLKSLFVDRSFEVWNAAKMQYPEVAKEVAEALAKLIESGRLREKITGEQLYWLFERLGIHIRLETKIRILESGELKTIADKLKGE